MSDKKGIHTIWVASNNISIQWSIPDALEDVICFIPGDILGNAQLSNFLTEVSENFNVISVDYQHIDWKSNELAAKNIAAAVNEFSHTFSLDVKRLLFVSYSRGAHIFFKMIEKGYMKTGKPSLVIAPLLKMEGGIKQRNNFRVTVNVAGKVLFKERFKLSYSVFKKRFLTQLDLLETQRREVYQNSVPLNRNLILDKTQVSFREVSLKCLYIALFDRDELMSIKDYENHLEILKKIVGFPLKQLNLSGAHLSLNVEPKNTTICLQQIFKPS